MDKKKIAIIGATGYTGSELVRLLYGHPQVEIVAITSESRKGETFDQVHPAFRQLVDLELTSINDIGQKDIDLAFLALPHGVSMDFVKEHADADFPIVDLSGDFRLDAPKTYEDWYSKKHVFPEGFEDAAYGIPELNRDVIKTKKLIANPGCFPTSAILGLAPLCANGLIEDSVIVDAKTGVTGAGVKAKETTHFPNVNDNFKAYGVKTHRHTIEIEEKLSGFQSKNLTVQFTPHLLPVDRGILATSYAKPKEKIDAKKLKEVYQEFYANEPFIRLIDKVPELKNVRGTNFCDIFVTYDERTGNIICISAIDNLMKGAAGQAVQNMNLLFGFKETQGLDIIPLKP